jgi:riboflavin kinase/FMN adenylyltransferase
MSVKARAVAVGPFDGVHLGDQALLRDADAAIVLEIEPPWLTTREERAALLAAHGVTDIVELTPDAAARLRPDSLAALAARLSGTRLVLGSGLATGAAAWPRLATTVVAPVMRFGAPVTAAAVRAALMDGDVDRTGILLGRPFSITGSVAHGDARGRTIGFPTANLALDPLLVAPARGVYACTAGDRSAAVNIGVRPTFDGGSAASLEAHLLDFSGDLYGQALEVVFHRRLRDERRFDGVDALVAQIHADVEAVRAAVAIPPAA